MSEYKMVEKPFLDQLKDLGWRIIEHDRNLPYPVEPKVSERQDFKEIVIKALFKNKVKDINRLEENGSTWLTEKQLDGFYNDITTTSSKSFIDSNKEIYDLIIKGTKADCNHLTGEEYPSVKFIDFKNFENNDFLAISQYRIDTPGKVKKFIVPDIVLLINGIPVVVIECKELSEFCAEPMEEGITQLLRYMNRREEEGSELLEGEEKLFYYNQFVVSTYSDEARYGSVTSDYEHFLEWKDIYPEKNKKFNPPLGVECSQEKLIQGMLHPETLLDIIKNFIVYMTVKETTIKIISRYQQLRAVYKTVDRLKKGETSYERSGVIWHTQGSGKSLTMVFLVKKIRTDDDLKGYKVIVINDRTDLEEQLGDTMSLTGETIDIVENTQDLKTKGATDTSNVLMAMIHKFNERDKSRDIINEFMVAEKNLLPEYVEFGEINSSSKILILVDEAHRTQSSSLNMNMMKAFPNASAIGFTGTPLITSRNNKKTIDIFGGSDRDYIDKYRLKDAIKDGATLPIVYIGKTSDAAISNKTEFDNAFEDLFKNRTKKEILLIKKKYGTKGDILEAPKRIDDISRDIVRHYVDSILPNNFKAQVVASSKRAAINYQKGLNKAIQERILIEESKANKNEELIEKLKFIKTAVVISVDGTNEDADITKVRKESKDMDAIQNFKKTFDYNMPNTGIAFLIVCDMLLTGFDAPIEQVMYLDKKMVEHNLLQAIARVNRTREGKKKGFIVDYIGVGQHLAEALSIYDGNEESDTIGAMENIDSELPILRDRYIRLLNFFRSNGVKDIQSYVEYMVHDTKEQIIILEQCVDILGNEKLRASFDVNLKKFLSSMDVLLPNLIVSDYVKPMKAFTHIQMVARNRYKDTSVNLMGVGNKVKKLINEYLIGLGIDIKIKPIEITDKDFKDIVNGGNKPTKAKASEMEHAIRKHLKFDLTDDPILNKKFSEKLDDIIEKYKHDIEERYNQLSMFLDEVLKGREEEENPYGVENKIEQVFIDLLISDAYDKETSFSEEEISMLISVNRKLINCLKDSVRNVNWNVPAFKKEVRSKLSDILMFSKIKELILKGDKIIIDIMNLADKRREDLVK